jgi:hypothetical protein
MRGGEGRGFLKYFKKVRDIIKKLKYIYGSIIKYFNNKV